MKKEKNKRPVLLPHTVSFRVDDAGKAAIKTVAKVKKMTASGYARKTVMDAVGVAVKAAPTLRHFMHAEELRQLLAELGHQGSNLNQLTRHVNSGGRASDLRELIDILTEEHAKALRAVTDRLVGAP